VRRPHPGWLDDAATHRRTLVDALVAHGAIRTPAVREAFASTPRELFVPGHALRAGVASVYANEVLVTAVDAAGSATSSSSQPQLMAAMLETLDVRRGMSVLEIGTGTGYNAALLRHLVGPRGRVVSVEVDPSTAAQARQALDLGGHDVQVVVGDGAAGHPAGGPYDRIIVTASSDGVPPAWAEQLSRSGLLEVPLRLNGGETQAVATMRHEPGRLVSTSVLSGRFMPLRGGSGDVRRDAGDPPRDAEVDPPVLDFSGPDGAQLRLAGASVGRLGAAGRAALDAGWGSGRHRPLGLPARTWDLVMFVSLEVPTGSLVSRWPELSVGVLDPDGGLALVVGSRVAGSVAREQEVVAFGPHGAEAHLLAVIERWESLHRPRVDDLVVEWDACTGSVTHRWAASQTPRRDH